MQYGAEKIIQSWPEDSHDTAEIVLDKYGESDEATSFLIWYNRGPWKITITSREATPRDFPILHTDIIEQTSITKYLYRSVQNLSPLMAVSQIKELKDYYLLAVIMKKQIF